MSLQSYSNKNPETFSEFTSNKTMDNLRSLNDKICTKSSNNHEIEEDIETTGKKRF
jgi:hypothetical protein